MDLYYQMHLLTEFLEPPTNMSWYRELSTSQDDEPVRKGKKKFFQPQNRLLSQSERLIQSTKYSYLRFTLVKQRPDISFVVTIMP